MSKPSVAIIILNWNGLKFTLECLESLRKCTYPNLVIIIVDNGSKESEGRILKEKYPDIIVSEQKHNLGFAEGNNVGMRIAKEKGYDYVLLLNNDTIVDPGFLELLVDEMEKNPQLGAVSPLIFFEKPPDLIWFAGGFPILLGIHGTRPFFRKKLSEYPYREPYETKSISGCAFFISHKTLREIGLLDPEYFSYCEDTDYSYRILKAGKKMAIVPASRIWHKVSSSGGGANNPVSLYLMGRGLVLFLRKNSPWYVWFLFLPFCIAQMAMDFRRGGIASMRARLRGYIHGFRHLLNPRDELYIDP